MKVKLYELAPTRSARVRWTLLELGIPFESVSRRDLIGSEELRRVHPLGKLPAVEIDGKPLFESAAIATYLADSAPEKGLIARPGTYERGLHDQWTSFALTEMEAYLWSTVKHMFFYPEEKRVPAVIARNQEEIQRAAAVLDETLGTRQYLVGDRFSVTDIIVGFTVNWARYSGQIGDYRNLLAYNERLFERPHCTLGRDAPV